MILNDKNNPKQEKSNEETLTYLIDTQNKNNCIFDFPISSYCTHVKLHSRMGSIL